MDSENERIKLKATFWNDLAVAATASGIVIPILGSYHDDVSWNSTVFPVFSDIAKRFFVGAHPGHYHRGGFACLCELSNDETSRLGLNPPRSDLAAALGTEHEKGNYKALFAADASAFETSADLALLFDEQSYAYNVPYKGARKFNKHYFPIIGDLKPEGEEFRCAVFLDENPSVRFWVRNVDRKPNDFGSSYRVVVFIPTS